MSICFDKIRNGQIININFTFSPVSFFVANSFVLHHNSRLSCGRMALICFKTKAFLALKKIDIKGY